MNKVQAEDLFYVSKLLDIPVIAYGNRLVNGVETSLGACRLMALADNIEKIDMSISSKRAKLDFTYGAMNCSKTGYLLTKNFIDYSNVTTSLTESMGITADNFIYVAFYIAIINSFLFFLLGIILEKLLIQS